MMWRRPGTAMSTCAPGGGALVDGARSHLLADAALAAGLLLASKYITARTGGFGASATRTFKSFAVAAIKLAIYLRGDAA